MRDNFHLYRASLPPDQHREPPNQQRYQELLSHMQGYQHECSRFCPCNRVATQLSYLGRLFSHRGGGSCRILCFGLGSLEENGAGGPTFNLGAIKRHIVAGHVAARLQRLAAKKDSPATTTAAAYDGMHLFFDDPAYTARDRSFVRKCLPTVLDPAGPAISIGMANPALGQPQSFSQINSNTLVLAVHPEFPVRQLVMEMCTPAAMLWSDHMDSPLETTYDIESFYVRLRPDEPAGPATGGNLHSLLVPGTPM